MQDCNYSVKAPMRGTNLNSGLFVPVLPLCRDTMGKCSLRVKGKVYGFDVGMGFAAQWEGWCVLVCASARA